MNENEYGPVFFVIRLHEKICSSMLRDKMKYITDLSECHLCYNMGYVYLGNEYSCIFAFEI